MQFFGKSPDDAAVIEGILCQKNMNVYLKELYKKNYHRLYNYIVRSGGCKEDAEDIIQETVFVFVSMVQNRSFRGDSSISTCLYSICRYKWKDHYKSRKAALVRETAYCQDTYTDYHYSYSHHPVPAFDKEEKLKRILDLFDSLDESCKQILSLYYFEGLKLKEIQCKLKCQNYQVLRNKKCQCMKLLINMVNKQPDLRDVLSELLNEEI